MLTRKITLLLMSAGLAACGSSSSDYSESSAGNSSTDISSAYSSYSSSSSTTHSSEPPSSAGISSDNASSSVPSPIIDSSLPIHETFDHVVDSDGFFSTAYRELETSSLPFYHRFSGTHTFTNGKLTLEGGRFSIGNTQPETATAASDSQAFGEIDLSKPYRISFCLVAAEETGTSSNTRMMVYVNNNTTLAGESIHGGDGLLFREQVNNLIPGIRIVINSSTGTANSFFQLRTESGARVTIDDLWIGYQSDLSSEPNNISCRNSSGSSSSAPSGSYPTLSQTGNPVNGKIDDYKNWLSNSGTTEQRLASDKTRADNMITWQMPHGGFNKNNVSVYNRVWNGTESRAEWTGAGGIELGTIDNNATITEILFLADVYHRSGDEEYRDAARKAINFLLNMQYPSGGWPQVYPARTGTSYSNYVTFNDDAMIRVLLLLDQADKEIPPLHGDVFSEEQRDQIEDAIENGVDYILKSQIKQDGVGTVWCAQHHPTNYSPLGARDYELPSKSGKESVLVVGFLMSRPQSPAIEEAARAAIAWYNNPEVQLADHRYINRPGGSTSTTYNPITPEEGSTMWYRFYNVDDNQGFFSDRDGGKYYDIMDISAERRYGYQWGGNYGTNLLNYARSVGYLDD